MSGSDPASTAHLPRRLSAEARREQIKAAAARLFIQRGFESVTVADLAHDLQTSRPTIYSYFPSTEAILDELLGERLALLLERLDPLLVSLHSPASPQPAPGSVETIFRFLLTEEDTLRLLHSGGAPTFQARRQAFLSELGERLSFGPETLVRRSPHLLLLLTTLLDALAYRVMTDPALDRNALDQDALICDLNAFALGGAGALRPAPVSEGQN